MTRARRPPGLCGSCWQPCGISVRREIDAAGGRRRVGDLEVTALYDGTGVFDPHWLNGTKATSDGAEKAMRADPRMLDVAGTGFLVNTGKQRILVDSGAGAWWAVQHLGAWRAASAAQDFSECRQTVI